MAATTRITDLPDDCLACVLSFLPPALIARCAFVSSAWRAAAASPVAWARALPDLCRHPCFTALPLASHQRHPRAWCRELCRGLLLDGGAFHARMDPRTAKLTLSVSIAKACGIAWLNDRRYWHTETRSATGALFPEVPHLLTVCWLDLSAQVALPFPLRCGEYDVAWRMARDPTRDEYERGGGEGRRHVRLFQGGGEEDEGEELDPGGGGGEDGEEQLGGEGMAGARAGEAAGGGGGGGGVGGNPFHHMARLMPRLVGREHEADQWHTEQQGQQGTGQQQVWERRREAWGRVQQRCWFSWVGRPTWSNVREEGSAGGGGGEQRQLRISAANVAMLPDWTTFHAGRVVIRGATAGEGAVAPRLSVRLWETESGWWKDGLYFDALQLTEL
ncbi:hypothetical protein CLOM_g16328 [Closterium sp. NIES-68]|nr:hypothetical protein CLOM_g16328 [Closterium sp. NIES-68]